MIVINKNGETINLDQCIKIGYRCSLLGEGYPIEAEFRSGKSSYFSIDIARPYNEYIAKKMTTAIGKAWIANERFFDVNEWMEKLNDE